MNTTPPAALPSTLAFLLAAAVSTAGFAAAPVSRISIDTSANGVAVSPEMHGVFFEDINYGADGGLYAELVQNRSFEHAESLYSWGTVNRGADATLTISDEQPLNANNTRFARLEIRDTGDGFGVANYGFGGMAVKAGETYLFSVHARAADNFSGTLVARLEDEMGQTIGSCALSAPKAGAWEKCEGALKCRVTTPRARLVVLATGKGARGRVDLDMISLFPENTWKKRPNGLRADMVKLLADMKPGFLRFPGGCIVEGTDLANAYRWKDTVGDVAARKQNWNRWQHALRKDHAPQYYQTYGLGFFEYFQLCEDIGAAPVPIINCGMACQYQTGELVPLDELGPWVQDALDLIEFANGPATSEWGKVRADMGHPGPFNLKHLGIGNEQWGEDYFARYKIFYDALKAKHPEIILITTSGPGVDDQWWKLAWGKFRGDGGSPRMPAEIVDEHYYRPPAWFFANASRYDGYDRDGPKVFAGEFAAHEQDRRNTLRAALSEAAFMTGLLRNAQVVTMAAYAPLFAKDGATQWAPDLIWTDNTRAHGSPSYHVQKMYSLNRPDTVLPAQIVTPPVPPPAYPGKIGVGTWLSQAEFKDVRVLADDGSELAASGAFAWQMSGDGEWETADGGVLRQTNARVYNVRAVAGDASWTDCTLSLKARKLGGEEGFQIFFQVEPNGAAGRLNFGSHKNTRFGLDLAGASADSMRGTIETGRWYDVRVELRGGAVKCFLDGKLILQSERRQPALLYAVAGRDAKSGEIIVHVVNPGAKPQALEIDLGGRASTAKSTTRAMRVTTLTSESLDDVNTLDAPDRVSPVGETVTVKSERGVIARTLPARAYSVLRLK